MNPYFPKHPSRADRAPDLSVIPDDWLAHLRTSYPDEDDAGLLEHWSKLDYAIRWRRRNVVRLPCSRCSTVLPTSAFSRDSRTASGYRSACRSCLAE